MVSLSEVCARKSPSRCGTIILLQNHSRTFFEINMNIDQLFVEQAEYIGTDSFEEWSADHPNEEAILRKLTLGGAKLISGPRGCGKTTLMLKARKRLFSDNNSAFPVYVNFKRSLSIEPLYKSSSDGTYWFNQWIILKIYLGIYESLEKLGVSIKLGVSKEAARKTSALLEMSNVEKVHSNPLTVSDLELDINEILKRSDRLRCVLLLDDAAHAFSADQQRDFFDFFRQIKSQVIAPKAAVYPGVTNYSSSFHVGHDAEQIDVWIKPDSDDYLKFMHRMINVRFPSKIGDQLRNDAETLNLLCYAAFGVPRALLNMIQSLVIEPVEDEEPTIDTSRLSVISAIKLSFKNSLKLFNSLAVKIPIYETFIKSGDVVFANSVAAIKRYNIGKEINKQSVSIAVAQDKLGPEFSRLFGLFQYSGLCIPRDELISRGEKGRFQIFTFHYAGLIDSNALIGARSINFSSYIQAFSHRNAHEFTRINPAALLDGNSVDSAFSLSLPPCAVCNSPRTSSESKFCGACGAPLNSKSTYLNLLNTDISDLPLTAKRIAKIKDQSSIRKIKDILMDHEHKKLLQIDRIGKIWAARIVALAEEFVE